ncbi:MAG: molecular chaperone HtpG, partial [Proteobacteria bacterium]|nr:molecular chaperone HtpG [Pseudomonadota bacterium]
KTTSSEGKWVSLSEYQGRMKPDQESIYYITGENLALLSNSPLLEKLKEKGYEVLLMTDPVDEWVVQSLGEYEGKKLKSAEIGDLDLDQIDETKKNEFNALFSFIKGQLSEEIKEVNPSSRLKDSLSCLSGDHYGLSAYMEKILKASGQKPPEMKRVLELNMNHPAMEKIKALYDSDAKNPALAEYSKLLYDMAVIGEGGKVDDPVRLSRIIGKLMTSAIPG